MMPGDTVKHITTGVVAVIVSRSPSFLTLKANGVTWNDAAIYWRPVR